MIIQYYQLLPLVTMVMARGATFSGHTHTHTHTHTHILFTPKDEKHLCDVTTTGPLQIQFDF